MNTVFVWDKNSLCGTGTVSDVYRLIDTDIIREMTKKMKNVKAAGPSGLVSAIVNSVVEVKLDAMINLICKIIAVMVNQISGTISRQSDSAIAKIL